MQVNRPSYNATPIFNNISAPAAVGFISGVNRALPFGYNPMLNPMLNPMFALAQTLGPSLAQFLASLFGNKNGSTPAASNNRPTPTEDWKKSGAKGTEGSGGSCGGEGSKTKGTSEMSRDSGPGRDRSETPGAQQDSSRSTRAPQESSGADDHAGHNH